jgi:hypothetical protein
MIAGVNRVIFGAGWELAVSRRLAPAPAPAQAGPGRCGFCFLLRFKAARGRAEMPAAWRLTIGQLEAGGPGGLRRPVAPALAGLVFAGSSRRYHSSQTTSKTPDHRAQETPRHPPSASRGWRPQACAPCAQAARSCAGLACNASRGQTSAAAARRGVGSRGSSERRGSWPRDWRVAQARRIDRMFWPIKAWKCGLRRVDKAGDIHQFHATIRQDAPPI